MARGDYRTAADRLAGTITEEGVMPYMLLAGAHASIEAGDFAKGEELAKAAIEANCEAPSVYLLAAEAACRGRDVDEAIRWLDRAVEKYPDEHSVLLDRGALRLMRKDLVGAEEDFNAVGQTVESTFGRALVARVRGDVAAALDLLAEVIRRSPEGPVRQRARRGWEQLLLLLKPQQVQERMSALKAEGLLSSLDSAERIPPRKTRESRERVAAASPSGWQPISCARWELVGRIEVPATSSTR
jgi:tetratricopeptide (TPR) repeat protein